MSTVRFTVNPSGKSPSDVVADIGANATGEDLRSSLRAVGMHLDRLLVNGVAVGDGMQLKRSHLTHGAILAGTTVPLDAIPSGGWHLVVVSGPEAGGWFPMHDAIPLRVGRLAGDVVLSRDLLLSKEHAEFLFQGGQISVRDLGSSNGTRVEGGDPIVALTIVDPNAFIHVGSSVLTIIEVAARDAAVLSAPDGPSFSFPRTFREALPPLPIEIRLPRAVANQTSSSSSTWWRSLLPLVTGVGFAVVTKNYFFLILSALAPIVYAADAYRLKRRRHKEQDGAEERWRQDDAAARAAFDTAWREERRRARALSPVGGIANVFATLRHRRLWERRPSDSDFCCVTVGLAPVASNVALVVSTLDDSHKDHEQMWGTPVAINLATTGALAVLGDRQRARAVARGMLLALASTHSPSDLRIWVFGADSTFDEWGPARWLPHAMQDDQICQIATTAMTRASLASSVRKIVDQRRELRRSTSDGPPIPIHVAVFDGADVVSGRDMNEILTLGPALGVVGIVVDPSLAPDGIMGTLTLGVSADAAVFESRSQPRVANVLTAEMPSRWAESSARRLAALRPAAGGTAEQSSVSERLARLLGSDAASAQSLARQWSTSSGSTRVPVGTTAQAPFFVDLVREGPHGLVGGMTRSGKTEFLKTLITALAWANHPDDLCFVIVDFKGGIDYTAAIDLPHVLDVSSNQDLDGFERTIRLLAAELRRRQQLFERAGVANLDAYRVARQRDTGLVPMPRLVALIDEFGEMLSSEVGKEQLRQVESMARIGGGLGVHLLLVTQNFEGQLPDQVAANAGFRVCFRVQDPAHSKIVIGSGIGSTVPPGAKGRGYASLQGAEPTEFQSARIAGRRPDLVTDDAQVTIRLQPFDLLSVAFEQSLVVDVPTNETDMQHVFDLIRQATKLSGWQRPAVPWPRVLPSDLSLASVLKGSTVGEYAVGLADLPNQQRQAPFTLKAADDHVALLGGPSADLSTALITLACSAAVSSSPNELHLYAIDFSGRGLARIAGLPHCGAVASRSVPMAMRIAKHLVEEAAFRRSEFAAEGVSSLREFEQRTGRTFPHVLVLISGAEKLSTVGSYDEPSPVSPLIASLITEGSGLGIQIVAAGVPGFGMYRPGSQIEHRIVFATSDTADYLNLGCPRAMLAELGGPRRGVDINARVAIQIASLAAGRVNEADAIDAIVQRLDERWFDTQLAHPPRRFVEVGWPTRLSVMLAATGPAPARALRSIPVGIDATVGETVWLNPAEVGPSFFVAGGRRSGRSNALAAIALAAAGRGWRVLVSAASTSSPLEIYGGSLPFTPLLEVGRVLSEASPSPTIVVIDDVHRLDPASFTDDGLGLGKADLVVVSGLSATFAGPQRMMEGLGTTRARHGIVLMPQSYADLEPLNVPSSAAKPDAFKGRQAGQGFLGIDGELSDLTMPLVDIRSD